MKIKIKKCFLAILSFMMLCIMAPGHIAQAAPDVTVKVDGQYVSFPDQKPYIDSANRTMVPVRAPMEALGCKVEWDEKARKAVISKDGNVAEFTIGSKTYLVNGTKKTMDTKAVIVNDRTAFPIRFAAEAMGAKVDWDANTYTVLITTFQSQGKGIEKLSTTGLPGYKDPTLPNYKATIPFTSANGTEITGITYRDGAVRLQMGQKPVEMIRIYTDLGSQGATIKVGDNTTVQKTVGGGYESEFKVSDITKLQRFETLKIFIPGDGLYVVPNPFK